MCPTNATENVRQSRDSNGETQAASSTALKAAIDSFTTSAL
ncbi:MAG: tail fiber protein [Afipia sp.]|nr:tail fiber protein [Afipia sp.]